MNSSGIQVGLGFNPKLGTAELPWPTDICYLEAGTSVVFHEHQLSLVPERFSISLHLSRVPCCEEAADQDNFLEFLFSRLPKRVSSISCHLSGSYSDDIGALGLSTMFRHSDLSRARSLRFFQEMKKRAQIRNVDVLVENANFYEPNPSSAIETVDWINTLCERVGIFLLVDLAHIYMAAVNAGMCHMLLLGRVNFNLLKVVHVSGTKKGQDGLVHDGHHLEVQPEIWAMLKSVRPLIPSSFRLVVEHSDPAWAGKHGAFRKDVNTAIQISHMSQIKNQEFSLLNIGLGYFANIIIPPRLDALGINLPRDKVYDALKAWFPTFEKKHKKAQQDGRKASFRSTDWPQGNKAINPVQDFLQNFLKLASSGNKNA